MKDEVQFKNILKSIDSCISVSHITEAPKQKMNCSSIKCSAHLMQEICFVCQLCNIYGCFACLDSHIDHKFPNVISIKAD